MRTISHLKEKLSELEWIKDTKKYHSTYLTARFAVKKMQFRLCLDFKKTGGEELTQDKKRTIILLFKRRDNAELT